MPFLQALRLVNGDTVGSEIPAAYVTRDGSLLRQILKSSNLRVVFLKFYIEIHIRNSTCNFKHRYAFFFVFFFCSHYSPDTSTVNLRCPFAGSLNRSAFAIVCCTEARGF